MFIHSVGSSTPETFIDQKTVKELAIELFKNSSLEIEKYLPVFENTEIEHRPILMPIVFTK
jgi:predicted naringenin-chalcone synthase